MFRFVFLCAVFVCCTTFLLDGNGQVVGSNQYLTIDDKNLIDQEINSIRRDHERSLKILAEQLQQRFVNLENEIKDNSTKSTISILEEKNRELTSNLFELNQNYQSLNNSFLVQENELISAKMEILNLTNKLQNLENLQNIQQLQELQNVQKKVQEIDAAVNLLESHEVARNQDFLAFYNQSSSQIKTLQTNFQGQKIDVSKLNSTMHSLFIISENQMVTLENVRNETRQLIEKSKDPIVLSACSVDGVASSSIKFPTILASYGIHSVSAFQSTGKFTCEIPGIYYVFAIVTSDTEAAGFNFVKNSIIISKVWHVNKNTWSRSASGGMAVALDIHDTIWVQPKKTMNINDKDHSSCITIFKI